MDEAEQVCTACNKVAHGDGTWTTPKTHSQGKQINSLCPDCCHQRFPQFYSDYEEPTKRKDRLTGMLTSMAKQFRSGFNWHR